MSTQLINLVGDAVGELPRGVLAGGPVCTPEIAERFFPISEQDEARVAAARTLCGGCPVRAGCLEFALEHGEDEGVWGGLLPSERRELRLTEQRDDSEFSEVAA